MEPFVWKVCVLAQDVGPACVALRALAARVQAELPLTYAVRVPAQGMAASFLDGAGEALDMDVIPFELVLEVAAFFGPGCWVLPGDGRNGAPVVRAYKG